MAYSLVASGVITLILLGVAENEVIEALKVNLRVTSRKELRAIFLLTLFTIIDGVLEGILVGVRGILLCFESIPFIVVLLSGRLSGYA
jgi:hypothetical protein